MTPNSPVSRQEAAQELLNRRKARANLLDFTRYTMPEYDTNWHHELVANCLDRFVAGEIKRLMIFEPPRSGKSEQVSRRLPAFILGRNPNASIIAASYGADLASRMNRDVQRIMDSPEYIRLFPNTRLFGKNIRTVADGSWLRNSDMFEVVEYKGSYLGSGVGGALTGHGGHYLICDDPIKNRQEANSKTMREAVWDWYISTFRTRLAPSGGILLTVTRWHEEDIAGRLLTLAENEPKADQWTVINLPAISEEPIATYDKRTHAGQALWPNRFSEDELEATRLSLGTYEWSALYQQRPRPLEGGMFKRHWFGEPVRVAPRVAQRVRYWDKAGTESAKADYSAGVLIARAPDGTFYVESVIRGQWSALQRETVIKQTAIADKELYGYVTIWVEQEPGSGGKESAEATVRNLAGFAVKTERVSGDKETRAMPYSAQCEAGNVKIVRGAWNTDYLDELTDFPNGTNDDQVDGSSGAFNKLAEPTMISPLLQAKAKGW